jgi:UrcA family protein
MNFIAKAPDQFRHDSNHGRLILMVLWALFIAAIGKPSAPRAADTSAVVSLRGLDLSTEQGMQAARDRITKTARHLCDKLVDPWSLSHHTDYQQCVADATAGAMGAVQKQTLVASAKSPTPGISTP